MAVRNITANTEYLGYRKLPEYENWHNMKQRCLNPNAPMYMNYGGRGITICDRWIKSFSAFYEDMGTRTTEVHSLERKDVNGNYSPDNCTWASKAEQIINRRLNKNNTHGFKGVTDSRKVFAAKIWLNYKPIHIGTYPTREEAAYMYDQFALVINGEDAPMNFLGSKPMYGAYDGNR